MVQDALRGLGCGAFAGGNLGQSGDQGVGGLTAGGLVAAGVEPSLGGLGGGAGLHQDGGVGGEHAVDGLIAQLHAHAVLGVVLEQAVGPCGAVTLLVDRVRAGGSRTAPDRRAAGGVGDVHMVAIELGDQAGVSRLGAAGAGAGELEQGLLELAVAQRGALDLGLVGDLAHAILEHVLLSHLVLDADHGQRVGRAGLDAHAAAHAVQRADGQRVLQLLVLALHGKHGHGLGAGGGFLVGQAERADAGMRAHERAAVALGALLGIPLRHGHGHAALLVGGSALLELAVGMVDEHGDRQGVACHAADGLHDLANLLDQLGTALEMLDLGVVLGIGPGGGHVDLHERRGARVDGAVVHVNDFLALLQVGARGGVLHVAHGVLGRQDVRQREEGGLQDGVGALAHADLAGQVDGVDGVELHVVGRDVALGLGGQVLLKLLGRPLAVDHERAAGLDVLDDREVLRDVAGVVARHEVGLVDVVAAADRRIAEAQVADRHAAGLLRVVLEVGLHVLVGVVADDLDGVLVRADGAVAAQTPELALDGTGSCGVGSGRILGQGQPGDVVDDADGELAARLVLGQLGEDGEHGRGRRVLAAQAVTAAGDLDALAALDHERVDDVQIQRIAGAGLLGTVEHGQLLAGCRQRLGELRGDERTVQAHLHQAHLLALGGQVVDDLLGHVADAAHGDDHALGVGGAVIVEQLVIGAQLGVDLIHILFHHGRQRVVDAVAGLAVLEEDVAVLVATAHTRTLGVERMVAEILHGVEVAHVGQVGVIPHGHLLHLMGGTEAVEEVQERHAALDGGQVRDGGQVHDLLDVALGEHGEAGLTAGHDVGVVAEDVQRVRGNGTGRDMKHARQLLGCDLVHVGDHEQQALGSRVGGGQGTGGQRAVHGTGGAALGLHLAHLHLRAEDVLPTGRRPLVDQVGHGAGRGDGIDAGNLRERI